ncbi:MAG TPA: SRPBCC domain-containing protein [Acidimicrobiales bacterium]|jgi:uncharacterized protein YndB with AHSA1/START domain
MPEDSDDTSDPNREFSITRIFRAPRELVWRAWTHPEQFAQWFGPRGYSVPPASVSLDLRPGGSCQFTMVSDADGTEFLNRGMFTEVVEPERLVFQQIDSDLEVSLTLTDLGDGQTTMRIEVNGETRANEAIVGWSSSFEKLAESLEAR